jgi:hypothetical protein
MKKGSGEMKLKTVVVEDTVESVKNALQELDKSLKEGTGIAFKINIKNMERKKEIVSLMDSSTSKISSKGIRTVMELFSGQKITFN